MFDRLLKPLILVFCIACFFPCCAVEKKTICLNMIVKDESKVIERCLASVKGTIDYWVIVDTGSKDGTQKVIKEYLKNIPGELYERPWVNFAHNRNEALVLAKDKADYVLFIDADERLNFINDFTLPRLDKDCYLAPVKQLSSSSLRVLLINNHLKWKWKGVLHEELVCPEAQTIEPLHDVWVMADTLDGNRSQDPQKFLKDAQVLEEGIKAEPENARYVTFLAQCYLCAEKYDLALKNFEKRISMGGREEEVYWSLYNVAKLQELLKMPEETFVNSYCKAFEFRPSRAEPLFHLANYYYKTKKPLLGYLIAKHGTSIPISKDIIHVESSIYEFQMHFAYALCAFDLKKFDEAATAFEKILAVPTLPQAVRTEVERNLLITLSLKKEFEKI